jgi:hypothetical protein
MYLAKPNEELTVEVWDFSLPTSKRLYLAKYRPSDDYTPAAHTDVEVWARKQGCWVDWL